jgi:hypothetical protein
MQEQFYREVSLRVAVQKGVKVGDFVMGMIIFVKGVISWLAEVF